jgi:Fe-S-cluster-containing hydrogenase component 2
VDAQILITGLRRRIDAMEKNPERRYIYNVGDDLHCHPAEVVNTCWSVWISRSGRTREITGFVLASTTLVGLAATQPEYCRTIRYCQTICPGSIVILRHYLPILIQCYGRNVESLLAKADSWKTLFDQINGRPDDEVCGTFCRSPLVAAIADSPGASGSMKMVLWLLDLELCWLCLTRWVLLRALTKLPGMKMS